jgi:hypothetical protein
VRELLRQRQARQSRRAGLGPANSGAQGATHAPAQRSGSQPGAAGPLYRTLREQRTLLNSLVGMRAKTTGVPHGLIHAELRRMCGGPAVAQASVAQLQSRIDSVRASMRS